MDAVKELIHNEILKINPDLSTPTDMMAGASLSDNTGVAPETSETAVVHGQMTRMLRKPSEVRNLYQC